MAKKGQEGTPAPENAPDAPTGSHMILYLIVQGAGRNFWLKYGAAFRNRDGSWNLKLDLLPDANFQLRPPKDE